MLYKLLNQQHPDIDRAEQTRLELLYAGGIDIIKNAKRFIKRGFAETDTTYQCRIECASYINYFGHLLDDYTSRLFEKDFTVSPSADTDPDPNDKDDTHPFYRLFATDADRCGSSLSEIMRQAFTDAQINHNGEAFVGVDFPKLDAQPLNLLHAEDIGANRAYAYNIPPAQIQDYIINPEDRSFDLVVLKRKQQERQGLAGDRSSYTLEFKVWERIDGLVTWKLFQKTLKPNESLTDETDIPLVDEGDTSFKVIPILRLQLPRNLCLARKLAPVQADHFCDRTSLKFAVRRNLHALAVFKHAGEVDLTGPGADEKRDRKVVSQFHNAGAIVISDKDTFEYVEPEGKCYQLVNEMNKETVDEMFRIVARQASSIQSSGKALARSGLSKLQDNEATAILLSAFGSVMRDFIRLVYTCISTARGENINWSVVGLTDYKTYDREVLLKESLAVNNINIPSPTFNKAYLYRLSTALLPTEGSAVHQEIKREIDAAVDAGALDERSHLPDEDEQDDDTPLDATNEDEPTIAA
jgi:hypothetical protein